MDVSATELVGGLGLQPHPEGGWYREIHRSPTRVDTPRGSRSALTTIYYLLEHNQLSRWHVVQADELWHFYGGAPLELLEYDPASRRFTHHRLGPVGRPGSDVGLSPAEGPAPVAVIPAGAWQAARSLGVYTLVGCTVGPGFEFADFKFVCDLPAHAGHFTGALAPFAGLL
jgi:predicted cupin superfamily sugar epimerase